MSLETIPFCKVFYPSAKDMDNFTSYMEQCDKECKTGIFKVVPPKDFIARKDNYANFDFKIPHPIEQVVSGDNGIYKLTLITQPSRMYSKYLRSNSDQRVKNLSFTQIENLFWKSIKNSFPLYGSDSPGSLFDKGAKWNLNEINNPLKDGLNYQDLKGITSPYLYFGCWKSMFCFHKEDMDLFSINYLHFGSPKHWYGIPDDESEKFDALMKKLYSQENSDCNEFLRHKNSLVNPLILIKNGINVFKCIQQKGEFVITKAASYHGGFNYGLNCAEAVNFITSSWISKGVKAKPCKCQSGFVDIDMYRFVENINENLDNNSFKDRVNKLSKSLNLKEKDPYIKEEKENKSNIEQWIQCENKSCKKWRKVKSPNLLKEKFICKRIKNITCNTKEENWKKNYIVLNKKRNKID